MKTKELADFLDGLLNIRDVEDESLNGLQVDNRGEVNRIGLVVDASETSFEKAREMGIDFLFVHHGLFWGKPIPLRGPLYRKIKLLIESDIAVYAAHLPLDLHPELGNNAQIEKVLGWPVVGDFGEYHGMVIGKEAAFEKPIPLSDLIQDLQDVLQCDIRVWRFGQEKVKRLGYVSGGALSLLQQAIDAGMDAFVTGEPAHSSYWMAKEAGINVVFGGHYATETLGIKAVGEEIEKNFGLETVFIDLPTGL